MKLATAIEEWAADMRLDGRGERTIGEHGHELRRLARWLEAEGLDWQQVTHKELRRYVRLRADKGFSSRSNMLCSLRVFYRWATEQDYTTSSPAAAFKTPSRPKPLPRALTADQVRTLLAHLRGAAGDGQRQHRDYVLVLTGIYTGLRPAELARLRWPAVDLTAGIISIRLSKMNHGRAVPIHDQLGEALAAWRSAQGMSEGAPVFALVSDKKTIRPNQVGRIVRRYARELRLPLTAHVLRHTFATWLLRKSGNLYAVSKALGHAQLQQTEVYVSADVEDIRLEVAKLPGLESW